MLDYPIVLLRRCFTPMTMETRCFKVFFPNYSRNRLEILVPPLPGKQIFNIVCSRGCTRRNLRFHVEKCQHADQKHLTRRYAFDLDRESTHGQHASCRARPVNVDDSLEGIRWIRGLGGEKLPAASYALLPNLKKTSIFCHRRGVEKFCRLFSTQQRANVFVSDDWPAPAT